MAKIKVIRILDDHGLQTLVGNVYELEKTTEQGIAITKCARSFYEGEYEVIEGSETE